jgi:hypothetical protein
MDDIIGTKEMKTVKFTNIDKIMAYFCKITYEEIEKRPKNISVKFEGVNKVFSLHEELSGEDSSLYESKTTAILAIRGVSRYVDIVSMSGKLFLNILPDELAQKIKETVIKISKMITSGKKVYLTGHSRGALILSGAIYKYTKRQSPTLNVFLFALPYRVIGYFEHVNKAIENPYIKKAAFLQDWASRKIVEHPGHKNIHIYDDYRKGFTGSHGIDAFLDKKLSRYKVKLEKDTTYKVITDGTRFRLEKSD